MLLSHLPEVFNCFVASFVFLLAVAYTAYRFNSRRDPKDPKKRNYHPVAIVLAPFLFPFVASLAISVFLLAAILYGVFLILFTILLVTIRKPFLFIWWNKFAVFVGEPLLKLGTYLIMIPIRLFSPSPKATQQQVMA